jgi:hypothetical protein
VIFSRITQQEARMDDEANDRREGYCDGMAGHVQVGRQGRAYAAALNEARRDRTMLRQVAEWKRRAALPEVAA